MLIVNAPEHPPFIADLHLNTKVVFLSPNTTSLTHSIDQGVTATFKAYYLRRTFAQVIAAAEEGTDIVLEKLQHL